MARYLPDDNLSYPVLIKINNYSGSGFFLNTEGHLYLVTARHVLFVPDPTTQTWGLIDQTASLIVYGQDLTINDPIELTIDLPTLLSNDSLRNHATADVAIIKIAEIKRINKENKEVMVLNYVAGVTQTSNPRNTMIGVNRKHTKSYSQVLISNEAIILGYPNSLGDIQSGQIDYSRPLLRKGIIAGKNNSTKTLILDCPVYQGNSGGMVIEVEEMSVTEKRFWIVGVVTEFVPFIEQLISRQYGRVNTNIENSGYSVVVPMDFVFELIEASPTTSTD